MSDAPEDDTIRVRRSWNGEPPGPDGTDIDETTAVSRRRSSSEVPPVVRERVAPPATGSSEPQPARPRRSTYIDGPLDTEETTDGSTIVARRESRRRASRDTAEQGDPTPITSNRVPSAPGPPLPEQGRVARTPDGTPQTSGVRRSQPVVSPRSEPVVGRPQAPVGVVTGKSRRHQEDRRATFIVVGTASAIVVTAASALIAIVLSL